MTESSSAPIWHVVALAGRTGSSEILVEDRADVAALPISARPVEIEPFAADAYPVVEEVLAAPIVPLRLTWLPAEDWRSGTMVAEVESLEVAPSGFRWAEPSGVLSALVPEPARAIVHRRRDRLEGRASPLEPSWARPGWFARASDWMSAQLDDAGFAVTEAPRLVYQGPLGAVLRAQSNDRATFLKCAPPAFPHEASITHTLSRRTPAIVPAVIASEPIENWLLMHDHGGQLVDAGPESRWPEALGVVAELQRSWIPWTSEISAAGGQLRPLDQLAMLVTQLLDRDDFGSRLDETTRAAWVAATPRLVEACVALMDIGIPDTLIHGDLHPGNIVVTSSGHVVVDWSDAAIGNPFVDLATYLVRTKDRDLRRRVIDRYIDGWDGFTARARLDDAAALAFTVGSVYQVATYLALLPALDPPDRALFAGADVNWAKRALDALEQGLDVGLASQ